MNFAERRKQAEAAGMLGSGDYFKLKEGDNRFRLMSECLPHPGEYQGKPNFKWLCYVIDRRDGQIKPFFMPNVIYKGIEALQLNDDYAFADVPMPYDLTINAKRAGTIEVEYTLLPARKESPITATEHQEFAKIKPIDELQKALREKTPAPSEPAPVGPMSADDIGF